MSVRACCFLLVALSEFSRLKRIACHSSPSRVSLFKKHIQSLFFFYFLSISIYLFLSLSHSLSKVVSSVIGILNERLSLHLAINKNIDVNRRIKSIGVNRIIDIKKVQ